MRIFRLSRLVSHEYRSRTVPKSSSEIFRTPTIYALSTAPAKSAIGVIRITGAASLSIFHALTRTKSSPQPRKVTLRKLYSINSNPPLLLDEALLLYFPGPKSYTGEDLLELHLHGGNAVIKSVLEAIESLHTPSIPIRYAEPGEFSKKAFQNGRMDLTQVEGINDLIQAETETQRISSITSMKGDTKKLFTHWREEIIKNFALLTTVIDFGEDHDIEEIDHLFTQVESNIKELDLEIHKYLEKLTRSAILMNGIKITLSGPPNAGKSSLLNVIANDDKAIVSDIAGTTRDSIDIPLDIGGYKVIIGDTAGIRNSDNVIEIEGIRRAKNKFADADLNLIVIPCDNAEISDEMVELIKPAQEEKLIVLLNKSDLASEEERLQVIQRLSKQLEISSSSFIFVSCYTNEGINDLLADLTSRFKQLTWTEKEDPISISKRAQDILEKEVLYGFQEFYNFREVDDVVLAAEGLKSSIEGIGRITGEAVGIEEVLGVVFSSFCIGK
ncbi:hypothetical protein CANARDRAFT_175996 [[Candida] arabinofermentans NRRL YB-2248]|uniref:TrmE-type G domain-containing protein n=1 Tax=[Candida] arabinofermentans NRRL YB-2248 TaxID=983967 RepID=A0A1E4T1B8_9ASCO|nr:hypothetical protein CANARDRAFT_175996 [[Candida] arabinofermentans NRRL YB-2248]